MSCPALHCVLSLTYYIRTLIYYISVYNRYNNKYIYNAHNYCQKHHRGAVGGQQLAVNK